jgi:protein-disulfide isomerase
MPTLKIPVTAFDHIQGNEYAPITLVEYGDYECSSCGEAYPVIKQIQEHFGHQLRFVFRNFPRKEVHPNAELAAETAEFAAVHYRFWEAHDMLFENQKKFDFSFMLELVETLNLPVEEFSQSIESSRFVDKIQTDFVGGLASGVKKTPRFFINGRRHNGSFAYEDLEYTIEQLLQYAGK